MKEEDVQKFLDLMKKHVGTVTFLSLEHPNVFGRGIEVASRDAIRHFANGIGDINPLWRSVDLARNSRYGGIIAPPTFLLAVAQGLRRLSEERIPGFLPLNPLVDFEWYQVIHENDRITVEETYMEPRDLGVKEGVRRLLDFGKRTYRNQRDEVVGTSQAGIFFVEIAPRPEKPTAQNVPRERYQYSKEELEAIDRAYEEEEMRGANPRYWDDILINDEIKPIVRGPLTHADVVAFLVGTAHYSEAHGIARRFLKQHPIWGCEDPGTNVTEWGVGVHMLDKIAQFRGQPMAFGLGTQTFCWFGSLITNWVGDDGFLKKLSAKFEVPNWHGDSTWCRGKVTKKYIEDNQGFVDIQIWAENQRGIVHTRGQATVTLPVRKPPSVK
jgi:acyl dehydratase